MSRNIRNIHRSKGMFDTAPQPREAIALPCRPLEYRTYKKALTHKMFLSMDREFAPYQDGEILWVQIRGSIKLARVVKAFAEWMPIHGHYTPKYRVQTATKDGHWSNNWVYIWPGDIYHGYFIKEGKDEERVRDLPAEVTLEALREGFDG